MDDASARPERYVEPRTGLRQARRSTLLAALFAVLAGAAASVLLFAATALWPGERDDQRMSVYFATVWASVFGMMVFSTVKRRWWLTLCFVLGVFPGAFVMLVLFNFCC